MGEEPPEHNEKFEFGAAGHIGLIDLRGLMRPMRRIGHPKGILSLPNIASFRSSCLKEAPCCPSGRSNRARMNAPEPKPDFLRATPFTRCFFETTPGFVVKTFRKRPGTHAWRASNPFPSGNLLTKTHRRQPLNRSLRSRWKRTFDN